MTDERPVQEAIARCVSIMVSYHNSGRTAGSLGRMGAEIRGVAATVAVMARSVDAARSVDRQVEGELMARYGHELGPRLFADFLDAFRADSTGRPGSCRRTRWDPDHRQG